MTKKILLIVEDDKALQKAISEALTDAKFEVMLASDGNEGMSRARKKKPDLILLDLILPDKDGYKVLLELKKDKKLKKIPVIIFTVIDTEVSIKECKAVGAVDYLIKPNYSLKEVVKKVKQHLR